MSVYSKTLITGGGGMLAHAIIRSLKSRGVEPIVFDRAALDISDAESVMKVAQKSVPTLIINCAAYTKVDLCEQETELADKINGNGAAALAAAAKASQAKLVHFSTDFVFNGNAQTPYKTDAPTNPLSAYGRSKLLGEIAVQKLLKDQGLIIRTAWLYGPGGPSFPKTMLDVARAGKPLKVVNDQRGAPTFTYDLAEATLNLLDRDAAGIFHVTNSGETTWFDFAKAIFEEFGLQPNLQPTTSAEWKKLKPMSAHRPAYSAMDLSRFEAITGRSMRPWREALREFRNLMP